MFSSLLKMLGLSTSDDVIGFLVCGMTVLPAFLFIAGERNAAAVTVLVLFNALLVFAIRAREHENLRESLRAAAEEEARRQAAVVPGEDETDSPKS